MKVNALIINKLSALFASLEFHRTGYASEQIIEVIQDEDHESILEVHFACGAYLKRAKMNNSAWVLGYDETIQNVFIVEGGAK
jgi:hypothetical protein